MLRTMNHDITTNRYIKDGDICGCFDYGKKKMEQQSVACKKHGIFE